MTTTKLPNSPGPNADEAPRPQPQDALYLHWKRRFAHFARWLHTYLSMLSFAVIFFFAVTGITLNHAEWFDQHRRLAQYHGTLNPSWLNSTAPGGVEKGVAKDEIVGFFRSTYKTKGALSDFHVDGDQCEVLFKGPGYEGDATIDRQTGKYDLTISPFSIVAILNDLHKGRDTGKPWSAVIDFSAILLTFVSLTGLTLIFFLNKRRFSGLVLAGLGALLCYLVYSFWIS